MVGAREVADEVGACVSAVERCWARWRDPRARLVRRRRAAGATGLLLGGGTGVSAVTTAALVVGGTPEWLWLVGGGATSIIAVPAVVAIVHWRDLRRTPLSEPIDLPARRPGPWSVSRSPLRRLAGSERALKELTALLQRDGRVPSDRIAELRSAATEAARELRAEAAQVGALERAASGSAVAARELTTLTASAVRRLNEGVDAHETLVAAAGRALGALDERLPLDLRDATEQVDALSEALAELAETDPAGRLRTGRSTRAAPNL